MKGQDIKTLRNKLGLSQRQFAKRFGVSKRTVAYWESGKTSPGEDILSKLAELPVNNGESVKSGEEVKSESVKSGEEVKSESVKSGEEVKSESMKSGEEVKSESMKSGEEVKSELMKSDEQVNSGEQAGGETGDQVQAYYETMYEDAQGVISLCTVTQPKDSQQKPYLQVQGFYDISQIPSLLRAAERLNGNYHIYTGIHPLRERPSVTGGEGKTAITNRRGKEKDILGIALFAADVDAKDFIEDKVEKQKANEERAFYRWSNELLSECKVKALTHIQSKCDKVSIPPTAIIDSGHGYYPIFKLLKFVEFENDLHREELKNLNKVLHKVFSADATFDFARILRVPGTRNIKPGYPALCKLIEFHPELRYTLDDIRKFEKLLEQKPEQQSRPVEGVVERIARLPQAVYLDDQTLIEKAKSAKDGAKFTALWEGDISGYKSQSEADLALCCLLAFWTGGDYERIDRLFRQSGLYREDKWGERLDYRERTINAALSQVNEFYDPNSRTLSTRKTAKIENQKSEQSVAQDNKTVLRVNTQDIHREISLISSPTPEKIQKRLWDFVTLASHWNPTELGRFCDDLNVEYNVTKTWLRGWKRAVITEKQRRKTQEQKLITDDLPTISVTDRFMRDITDDIISALKRQNNPKPFLFMRSGMPTRIELDENGNAIAKTLTVSAARGIMERAANFVSETDIEGERKQTPINPPLDNVNDFLSLGNFPDLPPLVGISTAPIVAPDGKICIEEGYHPEIRYFYHATGVPISSGADNQKQKLEIGDTTPTDENVTKAKQLILDELLCDFPFANQASRANAVALMLNPFVRPLIWGATPLHVIDASTPGTGKTLLADIASMPFIPSGPTIMTAGRDDDEWRKRITAKLISAPSHILIDNVKLKLTSGDLSAALTAYEWEDRILGQSATIRLPVKCTWIATGNNLELSDEIARRSVWIRLDAKVERPWERSGFKHENLRGWVSLHRGEIITALLTFIRKWLAEGRPSCDVVLGSYEEWVKVVGGILKAVDITGFLENANELYEQLDADRRAWVEFFSAWAEKYGAYDEEANSWGAYAETDSGALIWEKKDSGEFVGTKELFPLASHLDDNPNEGLGILDAYLGSGKEQARRVNLGRVLQKRKDRVFGNYRFEILPQKKRRAIQYRLAKV
jgi:transcriptional regulator with XRE-family HTH domain